MVVPNNSRKTISQYVQRIANIFDIENLIQQSIDQDAVVKYYDDSHLGYRLLHSLDGSIHMALSSNQQFRFEDYLAQVNYISHQIKVHQATTILELGCGNGFNLIRLAEEHTTSKFTGIDITPRHIQTSVAKAKQKCLSNVHFQLQDFHHLPYPDRSFDFIFAVESICHAQDIFKVMQEIHRVLSPRGICVLFDGFRVREHSQLSPDEKMARYLIEKTLAVNESINIQLFLDQSTNQEFCMTENTDLSQEILPNLFRFHALARILLRSVQSVTWHVPFCRSISYGMRSLLT